jgi:hypothetical protein
MSTSPSWETQVPRYRLSRDIWPAPKPHFRHLPPIPSMTKLDDIWQYARQPVSAGDLINTEFWPHPSFEPLNESARRVHEFFLAGIGKSWLPFCPFEDGRVVSGLTSPEGFAPPPQPQISTDSGEAGHQDGRA